MTTKFRSVTNVITSMPTSDGAGVRLRRAFSHSKATPLDPFLMLDHFGSDMPEEFFAGFPMHPHRGIETVTYVLEGEVDHQDSIGNKGTIRSGDIQWMTAGRGIMHQEMPRRTPKLDGFQLWVNLPKADKMMPPRYRDIHKEDVIEVNIGKGSNVKVIAGSFQDVTGPVKDLVVPIQYLDVELGPGERLDTFSDPEHSAFAFVYQGRTSFGLGGGSMAGAEQTAVLGKGDFIAARAGPGGARFLLVSGRPLREPIAWGGPIVMNTQEELEQAFREIDEGTFIK
ncbi:MAG TPA: pirin family protein [Methanomassiliicoccales archaeon]|nr:pirin family protein [Methanomassiliicoccales archaeon]